jgi:ABC-type dipeptide/oligopeptide/nickel transport system permease subunit
MSVVPGLTQPVEAPRTALGDRLASLGWPGFLALGLLVVIVLAGAVGPLLWRVDPDQTQLLHKLSGLEPAHPLGTDQFGRDLLSRLLQGARLSLLGAAIVLAGSAGLGLAVGAAAGILGGRVDSLLSRLVDGLLSLPSLIVALGLVGVLGRSFQSLLIALVVTGWPAYARMYRGLVVTEREKNYVLAARALGCGAMRIAFRHILPNVAGPALVITTVNLGNVVLALASLSFLGLGVQAPSAEWGAMVSDARYYFETQPWLVVAPGATIALTVLLVNYLGDALRDLLDPRLGVRSGSLTIRA